METIKPITPEEVVSQKTALVPDEVIKCFNELIVKNWCGTSAVVNQNDAAEKIADALGISKRDVFLRQLLDIEDLYNKAGRKVLYDKPTFNGTYGAYFTFSKR